MAKKSEETLLNHEQINLLDKLWGVHERSSQTAQRDFVFKRALMHNQAALSRIEAEKIIDEGESVIIDGQSINKKADLPPELDRDLILHPGFPNGYIQTYQQDIDLLQGEQFIYFRADNHFYLTSKCIDFCRDRELHGEKPLTRKLKKAPKNSSLSSTLKIKIRLQEGAEDPSQLKWEMVKNNWQSQYGGNLSAPIYEQDIVSFNWELQSANDFIRHAEVGDADRDVVKAGGGSILEIMQGNDCLYHFVPQLPLLPAIIHQDVNAAELQAALAEVDILLLTATPIETATVLAAMQPLPNHRDILQGSLNTITYFVGKFGRYGVALCESTMGGLGRQGSTLTAKDAIDEIKPKAVLLLGIAFGVDRSKQRLGDVIVAESVFPYELQRVGQKITINRGTEMQCGAILSERFRSRRSGWRLDCGNRQVKVHQGQILSGEKLVDQKKFRDKLMKSFPLALGGEMEGAGAYSAAGREKVEMVLIKAICDWADGHKNDLAQPFAAQAAVSLAKYILSKSDVLGALDARDLGRDSDTYQLNKSSATLEEPGRHTEEFRPLTNRRGVSEGVNEIRTNGILYKEGERITTLSVSSDSRYLSYGGFARRILILSLETQAHSEVTTHKETVRCVRFAPLQNAVASSADDGTLQLDYPDEKEFRMIGRHDGPAYCIVFHPSGKLLASASRDSFANIWDIEKSPIQKQGSAPRSGGQPIQLFKHREGIVFAVDFDLTGNLLATCGEKGAAYIWNVETRKPYKLSGFQKTVFCIRFDPSGRLLAGGGADSTVRVWDTRTGECKLLSGHEGAVRWVSFHPSGRMIASASKDRTIRLWDLVNLKSWIMEGHTDYIYSVEFLPEGTRMFSAGGDGTVRVWDVPQAALSLIA